MSFNGPALKALNLCMSITLRNGTVLVPLKSQQFEFCNLIGIGEPISINSHFSLMISESVDVDGKVCSIQLLPLRDATVLNFTMPIFTAILAAVLLGENWGVREAAGKYPE